MLLVVVDDPSPEINVDAVTYRKANEVTVTTDSCCEMLKNYSVQNIDFKNTR